jgi:hypothetical protein
VARLIYVFLLVERPSKESQDTAEPWAAIFSDRGSGAGGVFSIHQPGQKNILA